MILRLGKALKKLRGLIARARYAGGFSEAQQIAEVCAALTAAGFDCSAGQRRLDEVLAQTRGRSFDFARDSIHWLVFACLRERAVGPVRILELGTFDGEFTAILSGLFPDAQIITLDLPESDPILRRTYRREDDEAYRNFVAKRDANIAAPNVHWLQINSVFLLDHVQGPFDLVWVDAGHLYPEVAWDLAHAHHLCRPGGWVLCDDVIPDQEGLSTDYVSPDSFRVLSYLAERTGETLTLFLKRCAFKNAGIPHQRKFVAMLERTAFGR
jgi:predicted O-methyltransferase YrrM